MPPMDARRLTVEELRAIARLEHSELAIDAALKVLSIPVPVFWAKVALWSTAHRLESVPLAALAEDDVLQRREDEEE